VLWAEGWSGPAATSDTGRVVDVGLVAVSATIHATVYVALLATFGMTLLPGREPLITALSRRLQGGISTERAAYTRGATRAWCCFFAGQLGISLMLFLWANVTAWSLFVNVLNFPLVVAMFTAEHVYRMLYLPDAPRYSASEMRGMLGHIRSIVLRTSDSD